MVGSRTSDEVQAWFKAQNDYARAVLAGIPGRNALFNGIRQLDESTLMRRRVAARTNPTYLYYTLGKLEIYKLRSDYQKAHGANYSLREFHDAFVKQGIPPIKMARKLMLPNDTSSVL